MSFTEREILEAIFWIFGLIFGLLAWFFLSNRGSHVDLHRRIDGCTSEVNSNLLVVYRHLAGKDAEFPEENKQKRHH